MPIDATDEWLDAIAQLECSHLQDLIPDEYRVRPLLEAHCGGFVRIRGLEDFWNTFASVDFAQYSTDLVIGAHSQQESAVTLILRGTPEDLAVYLSLGSEAVTKTLLTGTLPGVALEPAPTPSLARQLAPSLAVKGILSGIPSRAVSTAPLEQIVRGMQGASWSYIVQATPVDREQVAWDRLSTIDQLARVSSQAHFQIHASEVQGSAWRNLQQGAASKKLHSLTREGSTSTKSLSRVIANYRAQYLAWLLEHQLSRLDLAMATGQWTTRVYFGAQSAEAAHALGALLVGAFGGSGSRPQALVAKFCQKKASPLAEFNTKLASNELALLLQLPREETPGYSIATYVRFDSDFRPQVSKKVPTMTIGTIQHGRSGTPNVYTLPMGDLTKHALVAGVTGSGKTTTIMGMIDQVVAANIPFLVIEPTKTEYRSLYPELSEKSGLHIFTLGDDLIAPFRLNPFEFETDDRFVGAPVLAHIDFLKAVFNTAFILYAPMPYVLDVALHEIYQDKGWDLASGTNYRLPDWSTRHAYPIFPTLGDLYRKVDAIMDRLNYHVDVDRNVRAALKARIGSMQVGAKGLQLNTARGISMRDLLSVPTVLELESIGNDDEKTFLMGIVLSRLYEYRRLAACARRRGGPPPAAEYLHPGACGVIQSASTGR
jgi:hypothetical protein